MPYFAVAHHAVRQSDIFTGGVNLDPGVLCSQRIVDWRLPQHDGIVVVKVRIRIMAPAITDDENNGAFAEFGHGGM